MIKAVKISDKSLEALKRYNKVIAEAVFSEFNGRYFVIESHGAALGGFRTSLMTQESFDAKYTFVVEEDENDFAQVVKRRG